MLFEIIIMLGIFVSGLIAVLIYTSRAPFLIKLISMPSAILYIGMCIYLIIDLAGAPIVKEPVGKWIYVHHEVVDNGELLMLWAYHAENNKHRLYEFEYTREKAKKLNEAKNDRKRGKPVTGEFKKDPKSEGSTQLDISNQPPIDNTNYVKE